MSSKGSFCHDDLVEANGGRSPHEALSVQQDLEGQFYRPTGKDSSNQLDASWSRPEVIEPCSARRLEREGLDFSHRLIPAFTELPQVVSSHIDRTPRGIGHQEPGPTLKKGTLGLSPNPGSPPDCPPPESYGVSSGKGPYAYTSVAQSGIRSLARP